MHVIEGVRILIVMMMNVGINIVCPYKVKTDDIDNDCNVMVIMNTIKMITCFANVFFWGIIQVTYVENDELHANQ